jgi:hypothetical protein
MAATAATTVTTVSQLDGLFKEVYADRLENLIPDNARLISMVNFSERDREGNKYNQPVVLTCEHGVTYASAGDGAFYLMSPVAMTTQNAELNGSQLALRASIDYETASKAAGSKKAFIKSTELIIQNMLESITMRLELSAIYGGIGTGNGLGQTEDAYDLSDDDTLYLQLTDASWAVGIWAGSENAYVNFYNGTSIIGTAGSNGALGTADFKITEIDITNKRIQVSGDSTVLSTLSTTAQTSGTNLDIYWKDAYNKEMTGLNDIVTNTGTLFNINATNYHLWRGNTYAVSGTLTMATFLKAMGLPVSRGLNEPAQSFCNPDVWAVLNSELAGNRRYDGSYKVDKGTNGFKAITFYAPNGDIEIIGHPCIKTADMFVFPKKRFKRIGASDITFTNPGTGYKFFRELTDQAGFELRVYTHQALFCETPAKCLKLTGITVS